MRFNVQYKLKSRIIFIHDKENVFGHHIDPHHFEDVKLFIQKQVHFYFCFLCELGLLEAGWLTRYT